MGYACPVCGTPQQDAGHLANHLAFTALLGDDAHEDWLDEHAPGWAAGGEDDLADRVVEYAPEREFPQVFEDTVGDRPGDADGRSGAGDDRDGRPVERVPEPEPAPDGAVADVLREARAMTARRRASDDPSGPDSREGESSAGDGPTDDPESAADGAAGPADERDSSDTADAGASADREDEPESDPDGAPDGNG